ncbi:hypothetical protein AAFF_G00318110 [Aldrovandia affinis]|uniref:Uncharacterized protein n=1 Tax=Aldrovandia affinis TaxID=143900 RepID=A0AAD7R701_9TELE|nr:hypothetical protein AAFF_G00318110 [Aldrovandia affinis]
MALTVKEKAARHRQRIQNDPAAREAYLAKRKESYQRRRREGKIVKPRISQLSRKEQEKLKQQWKQDQRKHRERRRATEEILNFTPESLDTTPTEPPAEPQPNPPNTDRENIVSVDVMQPRASSTPQRVASTNSNKKWLREKAKMRSKMHKMKREIEAGK